MPEENGKRPKLKPWQIRWRSWPRCLLEVLVLSGLVCLSMVEFCCTSGGLAAGEIIAYRQNDPLGQAVERGCACAQLRGMCNRLQPMRNCIDVVTSRQFVRSSTSEVHMANGQ